MTGPRDLTVLHNVLQWNLTDQRWERVREALRSTETAAARQDPAGVQAGLNSLRRLGPARVANRLTAAVAGPPTGPAPDDVIELRNRLVHSLEVPPSTAEPGSPPVAEEPDAKE
ncbi:CATRA system-associated protein [Paractinoplanes rishiriensis]|uniref:CATRA-Associated Small Protein domain-containing protein n=1 Tax=Paractinoplanes rishiriensis TaxID=1050105 RepID=A0A919K3R1_9ACTN|nr:CATRA system-associated protein [Actinoplanes rishiriensis]GIE99643.1 hypothetical protein Ari01nite_71080 [Actinoplanes rishiriensis]